MDLARPWLGEGEATELDIFSPVVIYIKDLGLEVKMSLAVETVLPKLRCSVVAMGVEPHIT
eukprot:12476281-Prorocentrum_lima.AAC.1